MKKIKRIFTVVLIIVALLIISFIVSPLFVKRALIYQKADIDDYKIFPGRYIGIGTPQPWKTARNFNLNTPTKEQISMMEELKTVAFIVIQNKEIKYEQYWDDYNQSSLSGSFSAGKSIIGLLIGCAIDDSLITSVDQPVGDFIESFKTGDNTKVTIKDLLTMSSGIDWDEGYASLFSKTTEAYYGNNLEKIVKHLKVTSEPGKKFNYISINTQLLAFIIEKATGKTVSDYASEKLWKPLGAEYPALWSLDKPNGHEKAYCCFNSNARDFARIGQLVLDSGRWNGDTIISWEYLSQATSAANHLTDEYGNKLNYYGYQWWIAEYNGHKIPYARGILGQYIFVISDLNAVVVRLGHKRSTTYRNNQPDDIFNYLDAAYEVLKK